MHTNQLAKKSWREMSVAREICFLVLLPVPNKGVVHLVFCNLQRLIQAERGGGSDDRMEADGGKCAEAMQRTNEEEKEK